jgi:protein gp37
LPSRETGYRSVPFYYLQAEVIANATTPQGRRHRWLWLTKRPDRMAKFSNWLSRLKISWPTNLWAGTIVTMQQKGTELAICSMSATPKRCASCRLSPNGGSEF